MDTGRQCLGTWLLSIQALPYIVSHAHCAQWDELDITKKIQALLMIGTVRFRLQFHRHSPMHDIYPRVYHQILIEV